jgi:NitT/TauT family transport system substrate-binding protein
MLHVSLGRAAATIGLAVLLAAPAARAADKVEVQLDWVVRGNHAMFFVARDKGYFAENGIDVTEIRKGSGSPDTMRLVANGNAQFGFGDLPTLAVARSQAFRSWRSSPSISAARSASSRWPRSSS